MEKNVEMKDSTAKKPEEDKKEEVKVPNDKFYGKFQYKSHIWNRTKEKLGFAWKGSKGQGR